MARRDAKLERLRRNCRASVKALTAFIWPIIEPGRTLNWCPHHDAIAIHLEALYHATPGADGALLRCLGISVPPGSLKTTLVDVVFPLWCWLQDPTLRFLSATWGLALTRKSARIRLSVLSSSRWQLLHPPFSLASDAIDCVVNNHGGTLMAFSVGAGVTGNHPDIQILDDTMSAQNVTRRECEKVLDWHDTALDSRWRDPANPRKICIAQRLHSQDINGVLHDRGLFDAYLSIEAEYTGENPEPRATQWGPVEWRTERGELYDPLRLPPERVATLKKLSRVWSTQYQQSPVVGHGEVIDARWWQYYSELPSSIDYWLGAWDCAETDEARSDFTVGQVFAVAGRDVYLVEQVRGQWSTMRVIDEVSRMRTRFPQCSRWYVEGKSSGTAVVAIVRKTGGKLRRWTSNTSKESRVYAASSLIEAHQVHLPDPEKHPWVSELTLEATAFPSGRYDDQVDCMATALIRIGQRQGLDLGVQETIDGVSTGSKSRRGGRMSDLKR